MRRFRRKKASRNEPWPHVPSDWAWRSLVQHTRRHGHLNSHLYRIGFVTRLEKGSYSNKNTVCTDQITEGRHKTPNLSHNPTPHLLRSLLSFSLSLDAPFQHPSSDHLTRSHRRPGTRCGSNSSSVSWKECIHVTDHQRILKAKKKKHHGLHNGREAATFADSGEAGWKNVVNCFATRRSKDNTDVQHCLSLVCLEEAAGHDVVHLVGTSSFS